VSEHNKSGEKWGRTATKAAAVKTIFEAVRTGRIIRPDTCSQCGEKPGLDAVGNSKIQAIHTKGYEFEHRMDVVWMCVSCRNKFAWIARRERENEKCDICGEPTKRGEGEPRLTQVNGEEHDSYHSICFDCYLPGGYG